MNPKMKFEPFNNMTSCDLDLIQRSPKIRYNQNPTLKMMYIKFDRKYSSYPAHKLF